MNKRENFISGLRGLAVALENNPDMPLPDNNQFTNYLVDNEKAELRAAAKATPGRLEKVVTDSFFTLRREFDGIIYDLSTWRDNTCTPVVVGTKKVIKTEVVTPAVTREVEVEENIIEWDCGDILR